MKEDHGNKTKKQQKRQGTITSVPPLPTCDYCEMVVEPAFHGQRVGEEIRGIWR